MDKSDNKISRRNLFAGATGVGAVALAASLVPGLRGTEQPAVGSAPAPAKGGGYRLSDHVKQYYKTTTV